MAVTPLVVLQHIARVSRFHGASSRLRRPRHRSTTSQSSPSWMRPRVSQSSCSADASVSAKSVSELSRLYAKAARRLSISASASSMRRWWSASAGASSRVAI